jgi:hypothetical protein
MSEVCTRETPDGTLIITGQLHRVQRCHAHCFVVPPPTPPPTPVCRPARVAFMLALAHKLQQAIDRGDLRDQADAARRLGFNRARITQLFDLTLLAPDIQEQILALESVDGVEPITERVVRRVVRAQGWQEQRGAWERARRQLVNAAP